MGMEPAAASFDACFDEPHCIHIFSFSKAYALAGYRCGYLALHPEAAGGTLYAQMLKVQDTVPIAPSRLAQVAALGALKAGPACFDELFEPIPRKPRNGAQSQPRTGRTGWNSPDVMDDPDPVESGRWSDLPDLLDAH